jgi:hypothetical protein
MKRLLFLTDKLDEVLVKKPKETYPAIGCFYINSLNKEKYVFVGEKIGLYLFRPINLTLNDIIHVSKTQFINDFERIAA